MLIKNRYKIIRDLAEGGFGKTFLAKDIDWRDRLCVVKQLKVAQDHAYFAYIQDKFQQEAKVLDDLGEAIDHIPNLRNQIPKLYAYFTEANLFYLVQQWIPGQTLAEKVKATVLNEQQVRQFLVDILPVLQMIHERGIIHRDIKPGNLIMREPDGKPVLIDFGAVKELAKIAANLDPDFHGSSLLTNASHNEPTTGIGTPGFMAPEQETCEPVYPSTDLYSLGMTAIYALSGQIFKSIHTGKATWRLSSASLSEAFSAILDKAIQPNPFDRYSSAAEMLSAIQSSSPLPDSIPATVKILPDSISVPPSSTSNGQSLLRPSVISITGLLIAIAAGYFYSDYRVAQADLNYQKAQTDLKKIEDLKKQGNHQACVAEAQRFTQLHTTSYFNPTAEAKQLGSECITAILKNIATIKAKGDYATCITEAQRLTRSQLTTHSNSIAEAERLGNECAVSADLQNYLRVDIPKFLQEKGQSVVAKVISTIQPSVQVEGQQVTIIYDGSSNPNFVSTAGVQSFMAFFISAICGESKEFPIAKYKDFSTLKVHPQDKSITATVTKEKWDTYLEKFNRASSTTEQESIKKRFIEQIQISTQ